MNESGSLANNERADAPQGVVVLHPFAASKEPDRPLHAFYMTALTDARPLHLQAAAAGVVAPLVALLSRLPAPRLMPTSL